MKIRKKEQDNAKLELWKRRLSDAENQYEVCLAKMDERESLYRGDASYKSMSRDDKKGKTPHVRNIVAEIIEAEVDSTIPPPKVTAMRKEDEHLAKIIEDMLRCETDRLPTEILNDMMERTVPVQGGAAYLLEWDKTVRTEYTAGDNVLSFLHPKQIIPQDGVWTGIGDMDWVFLKIPDTKSYILRRYSVNLYDEGEEDPTVRGADEEAPARDLVTRYVALYRNEKGIGRFSWVRDTVLEDLEDYQAPNIRRCVQCGAPEPEDENALPTCDGSRPPLDVPEKPGQNEKKCCPECGGRKWKLTPDDYQLLHTAVHRTDGSTIGGMEMLQEETGEFDELGEPVVAVREEPARIPIYKPNVYPVFLQKNVSVFGQFLGDSDVDKIADQQRTINRISKKIVDKLVNAGSYLILPSTASIKADSEEMKVIRPATAADAAQIGVKTVEGDISQDLAYMAQVYEEARQAIGITDSMQGRKDATATSAKAKEFSAAQAAGRLESKKALKRFVWSQVYEAMFKFKLAYADEPRPIRYRNEGGDDVYEEFNRWDFLEMDPLTGEWVWNDRFLFSTDTASPLASNNEAMWQETRMNLQSGAFGDPTATETLILFWNKMDMLHYPGAGETLRFLKEQKNAKEQAQKAAMEAQSASMDSGLPAEGAGGVAGIPAGVPMM